MFNHSYFNLSLGTSLSIFLIINNPPTLQRYNILPQSSKFYIKLFSKPPHPSYVCDRRPLPIETPIKKSMVGVSPLAEDMQPKTFRDE
jgi:hypothetical protein